MADLQIYPVLEDPSRPKYREVHENLLSPPFRIAIVGASKSGKSNYLMNYFRKDFYGAGKGIEPCFTKVYVFSPNLGLDSTTRELINIAGDENMFTEYSDHIVDGIINFQKEMGDDRDRALIIADDLIALGCSPTARLFTSSTYLRHLDVSIIYLTQSYQSHNSLPPIVKNNLEGMVMFRNPSAKQVKSFCDDLQGTFGTAQNVKNILDYATQKPYHFGFFDYRDLRAFHNHTEFVWEKYDQNGNFNDDFDRNKIRGDDIE
jgi:hypothetical protein